MDSTAQQVQACKNDSVYKGERNADEVLQWNFVDTFSGLHTGSNANGGRPVAGRRKRNQNGVEPSTSPRWRQVVASMGGDWTRTTSQMMVQKKKKKSHILYHPREKNYGPPATESVDHDGSRRITKDHDGSRRGSPNCCRSWTVHENFFGSRTVQLSHCQIIK